MTPAPAPTGVDSFLGVALGTALVGLVPRTEVSDGIDNLKETSVLSSIFVCVSGSSGRGPACSAGG